jgi:hypothetical protein
MNRAAGAPLYWPGMSVAAPEPSDPRWELVQRVAHSGLLAKSRRQQRLLLFLCDRTLRGGKAATETEVAAAVFGRETFDPSIDTLIRVHASQLRRRLQLYFATEGAAEPTVIELGHGTYWPAFRPRPLRPPSESVAPEARRPRRTRRLVAVAWACGTAVLLATCAWLVVQTQDLRRRLSPAGPRPTVDRLWREMFGNGRDTHVILGDSSLTLFQDVLGFQLSPTEYEKGALEALRQHPVDPARRDLAVKLGKHRYTTAADAALAAEAVLLGAANAIRTDLVFAADARAPVFRSANVIVAGPRRSNPWVELFEERLNFRVRYDEKRPSSAFENRSPQPGEPGLYVVQWGRVGYCRVAYVPNLEGRGNALLVTGADMSSGAAGSTFITTEAGVRSLRERLGLATHAPVPYFEALLRVHVVASSASDFELVAVRIVQKATPANR